MSTWCKTEVISKGIILRHRIMQILGVVSFWLNKVSKIASCVSTCSQCFSKLKAADAQLCWKLKWFYHPPRQPGTKQPLVATETDFSLFREGQAPPAPCLLHPTPAFLCSVGVARPSGFVVLHGKVKNKAVKFCSSNFSSTFTVPIVLELHMTQRNLVGQQLENRV